MASIKSISSFKFNDLVYIHDLIKSYKMYNCVVLPILDSTWQGVMRTTCQYNDKQIIEALLSEFFSNIKRVKSLYSEHKNKNIRRIIGVKVDRKTIEYEYNKIYDNKCLYYAYKVANGEVKYVERLNNVFCDLELSFANRIEDLDIETDNINININNNDNNILSNSMDIDNNESIHNMELENTNENININDNNILMSVDINNDNDINNQLENEYINNINVNNDDDITAENIDTLSLQVQDEHLSFNESENNNNEMNNYHIENTLTDKDKLELKLDINEMKDKNILVNDDEGYNLLMDNKISTNISNKQQLKIINKNISKSNTNMLILNKKTERNYTNLNNLKQILIKNKKKYLKHNKTFKKMKRKKKRKCAKKKQLLLRIKNNLFPNNFKRIIDTRLYTHLNVINFKNINDKLLFDTQSKQEYNAIVKLQQKYQLFENVYFEKYNENKENIIKCNSYLQFQRCCCDPNIRKLNREIKTNITNIQLIYIKSKHNGYELLDNNYSKQYIISQGYDEISVFGWIDIKFDSQNAKLQTLIRNITRKQLVKIDKKNNDNGDDILEEFSQISSINS